MQELSKSHGRQVSTGSFVVRRKHLEIGRVAQPGAQGGAGSHEAVSINEYEVPQVA